ncbi:hypothetical protein ACMXYX_18145 (plasmid) [Neptuniibacter sp. QD72_48]|uniref:hypothetical protein n=1 Tax=Neptuniibacter sp. QD72_48 TaxID=3398214 RepID=UPI0039F521C4
MRNSTDFSKLEVIETNNGKIELETQSDTYLFSFVIKPHTQHLTPEGKKITGLNAALVALYFGENVERKVKQTKTNPKDNQVDLEQFNTNELNASVEQPTPSNSNTEEEIIDLDYHLYPVFEIAVLSKEGYEDVGWYKHDEQSERLHQGFEEIKLALIERSLDSLIESVVQPFQEAVFALLEEEGIYLTLKEEEPF